MVKRLVAIVLVLLFVLSAVPVSSASQAKLVALTFDDGPGPYTERLLNGLSERGIQATFFCQGSRAEQYPELVRRVVSDGHQLANHSYNHPNLNELSLEAALDQIHRTDQIFNEIIGCEDTYYIRPPYGNMKQALRDAVEVPVVIWSVDTIDWQLLNTEAVKNKILQDTFDGAIVLMHDIHSSTVSAVLSAVDTLAARGYEFVTVKELCRRRGIAESSGQLLYSCKPGGTDLSALSAPVCSASGPSDGMCIDLVSPDGLPVYYTLDGSDITCENARLFTDTITVRLPCTLRAVAAYDLNGGRSCELNQVFVLPPAGEPTVTVDRGKVAFVPSASHETVYVSVDGISWIYSGFAEIQNNSQFFYYANADGYMPTEVKSLLFSYEGNLFSDLNDTDWYYAAMDHCVSQGYFQLATDFSSNPEGIVTRAMLAVLLYRHAKGTVDDLENPFSDVDADSYYADAVLWGYEAGIFQGVGGGLFMPNRPVTRQELAKVLAIYFVLEPTEEEDFRFLDHNRIAPWAYSYVNAVSAAGYMQGSSGCFNPVGSATRAELAMILMRADQMK